MGDNKKNPNSSTIIQGLLELMAYENADDDTVKLTKALYDKLIKSPASIVKSVDSIVNLKDYADDKLTYTQHNGYNITGGKYKELTVHEITILDFLIDLMSQHNKVQLHIDDLADNLPMSRRQIVTCLKSLTNKGYIAIAQAAIKRKSIPAVYMVNPDIATCCKKHNINHLATNYYRLTDVKRSDFIKQITPDDAERSIVKVDQIKIGTIKQKSDCVTGK